MFDVDKWQEIFFTIRKNKLRTFLTAFSIFWGIFILMILLGFGSGLQHGVEADFEDDAVNSIWIRAGQTSLAYKGLQPGRKLDLKNDDFQLLRRQVEGVEHLAGRFFCWGEFTVRYKDKYSSFEMLGITPDHRYLENQRPIKGRYINAADLEERRKVAIIGTKVEEGLFDEGEDPIGKWINVRGSLYKVVGVYDDGGGSKNEGEVRRIFIPLSTAQLAYNGTNEMHQIMYTVGDASVKESQAMVEQTRQLLADKYRFDPADKRAVNIWNNVENYQQFKDLFTGIELFLWIVGAFSIVAGVVGVSNIMLIVVKERTREIGVRKALGATAGSIIGLVLHEAILITVVAGYIGLVAGIGLIELIKWALINFQVDAPYFKNPDIDITTALIATLLLAVAGTLAGYFPARNAAKVNPIVALRDE
jgi:putative ABC transport system permease protein